MTQRTLKGIDGWLLVFMALLVLTALFNLLVFGMGQQKTAWLTERYGPMPWSITLTSLLYNAANIALPLVIFWRMLRVRRWSSIRFAIAMLWLLFVGLQLADIGAGIAMMGMPAEGLIRSTLWALARNGFIALCSTIYLLASVRVANTYPRAGQRDLEATFE